MEATERPMSSLETARHYYAEELRAVANLQSEPLVKAFAKVPREKFLGPGPWQVRNPWYSAGRATAIEIEHELAACACSNLRYLSNVEVIEGDGGEIDSGLNDAILVNAGATHPRSIWLDSLRLRGRLLLPLTVENDSDTPQRGRVLKVVRQEGAFTAKFISEVVIFPCSGGRDPTVNEQLKGAFKKGDAKSVQSLRRDGHEPTDACWLHSENFCLSKLAVNDLRHDGETE